jgi:hypothetical protein
VKTANPSVEIPASSVEASALADQEVLQTQSGPKVNLLVSVSAKLLRDLIFFFSFITASMSCVPC